MGGQKREGREVCLCVWGGGGRGWGCSPVGQAPDKQIKYPIEDRGKEMGLDRSDDKQSR